MALEAASAGEALWVILSRSGLGSCVTDAGIHIEVDPQREQSAEFARSWDGSGL